MCYGSGGDWGEKSKSALNCSPPPPLQPRMQVSRISDRTEPRPTDVTSNPIHLSHCGGWRGSSRRQVHHSSEPARSTPAFQSCFPEMGSLSNYYTHAAQHPAIPQSPLWGEKTAKSQEGRSTDAPPSGIDFPLRSGAARRGDARELVSSLNIFADPKSLPGQKPAARSSGLCYGRGNPTRSRPGRLLEFGGARLECLGAGSPDARPVCNQKAFRGACGSPCLSTLTAAGRKLKLHTRRGRVPKLRDLRNCGGRGGGGGRTDRDRDGRTSGGFHFFLCRKPLWQVGVSRGKVPPRWRLYPFP